VAESASPSLAQRELYTRLTENPKNMKQRFVCVGFLLNKLKRHFTK
jgi:hypothetical protein